MLKQLIISSCVICLLTACQEDFDSRLKREAEENTELHHPIKVSDEITEDSLVYDKSKRQLNYFYTISGELDKNQFTTEELAELKKMFSAALRSDMSMTEVKENKVTFSYIYVSKSTGKRVAQVNVTPSEYAEK